jgi:hypothetical protein
VLNSSTFKDQVTGINNNVVVYRIFQISFKIPSDKLVMAIARTGHLRSLKEDILGEVLKVESLVKNGGILHH